jgi:hypothetical protein
LKLVVHAIFDKNGGCVAIDHRPDAHTPHPTYVSFLEITFAFLVETISWSKICKC